MSNNPYFAALDLGSNSFHLIIVKVDARGIQELDKVKHMVRLGEGLDEEGYLRPEAVRRALDALAQMREALSLVPPEQWRAVGTNTLRVAKNGAEFIKAAETTLGHGIDIISGTEEARLIYLGISEYNQFKARNLVVDIGGGSTEIIVGEGHSPEILRSLKVGCANMAQRFFARGKISKRRIARAIEHVGVTLEPHIRTFTDTQWAQVVLSSGTAKETLKVLQSLDDSCEQVTAEGLETLLARLAALGHCKKLPEALGVDPERAFGFSGGVCILAAVFRHLGLETAVVSQEALREGVLLELMGRLDGGLRDEAARTVTALQTRFNIDVKQAARVAHLAHHLAQSLGAAGPLLSYAAELHEIGLAVSLNKHQRHGAYLIANADLPGFSRQMQQRTALLVGGQRKKFPSKALAALPKEVRSLTLHQLIALRLAVLFYRGRRAIDPAHYPKLRGEGQRYCLSIAAEYLERRPLTVADLVAEEKHWARGGLVTLKVVPA